MTGLHRAARQRLAEAIDIFLAEKGPAGYASKAEKTEAERLAHYLKQYFRALEIDASKVDLEGIYQKHVTEPGKKMTAPQMQAAMIDAINTVSPMVDAKSKDLYDGIVKSLAPTYELGSKEVFKKLATQTVGGAKVKAATTIASQGKAQMQATAWAAQHCAQLVVNVDDTTKHDLAQIIAKGIENKLGVPGTKRLIQKAFPEFSKRRAYLIANTEIRRATSKATHDRMVWLGITHKSIVTKDPCAICQGNKAQGAIPMQQEFKGGTKGSDKQHPPFHPDCRCVLVAAIPKEGPEPLPQIVAPPEPVPKPVPVPAPTPTDTNHGNGYGIQSGKEAKADVVIDGVESSIILGKNSIVNERKLAWVDINKFETLFRQEKSYYIGAGGTENAIGGRYANFKDFVKQQKPIEASDVYVGKVGVTFIDGRHRYAVMRDSGLTAIPMALDNDSIKNAIKLGLLVPAPVPVPVPKPKPVTPQIPAPTPAATPPMDTAQGQPSMEPKVDAVPSTELPDYMSRSSKRKKGSSILPPTTMAPRHEKDYNPFEMWTPRNTIEEIERAAAEAFPQLRTGFSHCDVDKVNLVMEQFSRLEAKYPEIAKDIVQLKAESMLTRYPSGRFRAIEKINFGSFGLAPGSTDKYVIALAYEYFSDSGDKELLEKELIKESGAGFIPDNIPNHELIKSVLTHEFAHAVDRWIGTNILNGGRFTESNPVNDLFSGLDGVAIRTMLCRGADRDPREFFAYAFMEFHHTDKCREISKTILSLVYDVIKFK